MKTESIVSLMEIIVVSSNGCINAGFKAATYNGIVIFLR